MGATLDTSKAHLVRTHGDLIAIYSWINDERALILLPAFRKGAPWFCVLESAAYSWDDEDARNIPNVVRKSMKACDVLGIEPTPQNARRIAGIVIDGLPDLIRMPSAPPVEYHPEAYGRMTLKADGQAINQEDIRLEKSGIQFEAAHG